MNVKRFLQLMGIVVILSLFLVPAVSFTQGNGATEVTLLTTSDLQSQLTPYTTKVVIGGVKKKIEVGGAARIVYLVKRIKGERGNTLFLTSGDDFLGPWFRTFKGIPETLVWDEIADAWEPGNHEFDQGPEVFGKALDYVTFPVICSNIDVSKESALNGKIQRGLLKNVDGVKIGIFGLITPSLPLITNLGEKIKVNGDLVSVAREMVAALRKQGADIVVAVTHIGIDADVDLASKVDGIDVIVGGHSHTLIQEAVEVTTPDGGKTIIVQDGARAAYLGDLQLYIAGQRIDHYKWTLHLLDNSVPFDQFTRALISYFQSKMPPPEVVGESLVDLDARKSVVRTQEAAIGNLFTDAMNEAVHTTIAVTNGGGIRGDKIYPKGQITTATLTEMHPFGNSIEVVKLTGAQLKQALERGAAALLAKNDPRNPETIISGSFLQVSGLKYTIDVDKTPQQLTEDSTAIKVPGERVEDVLVNGEPLAMNKIYTVATNDYMSRGGDGYIMLKNLPDSRKNFTSVYLVDALYNYIKTHSPIAPKIEGRIAIKGRLGGKGS